MMASLLILCKTNLVKMFACTVAGNSSPVITWHPELNCFHYNMISNNKATAPTRVLYIHLKLLFSAYQPMCCLIHC